MRLVFYGYLLMLCCWLFGIDGGKLVDSDFEDGHGDKYKLKKYKKLKEYKKYVNNGTEKRDEKKTCYGKYCKEIDNGNKNVRNKNEQISKIFKKISEDGGLGYQKQRKIRHFKQNGINPERDKQFQTKCEGCQGIEKGKLKPNFLNKVHLTKARREEDSDECGLDGTNKLIAKKKVYTKSTYKSKSNNVKIKKKLKLDTNDKDSDEIADTDIEITENTSDDISDDANDDSNAEANDYPDSTENTCNKAWKDKVYNCEDSNSEEDDIRARKEKIKYSIKFAHEKQQTKQSQDDNIIKKIHKASMKKYRYMDDSDEDSTEDHTHPKVFRFVDEDDEYL